MSTGALARSLAPLALAAAAAAWDVARTPPMGFNTVRR